MINRHDIPTAHWSVRVGRIDPLSGLVSDVHGEIVLALDDVDQEVSTFVITPKSSVPTNPEKGCDVFPYIDKHSSVAIPSITREIWDGLTPWVTRIALIEVNVTQIAFAHFKALVKYRLVQSVLDDQRFVEVDIRG